MPPHSWIGETRGGLRAVELDQVLFAFDQVDRLAGFAAQADDDVGGHVGMMGEARQRAVELADGLDRRTAWRSRPCA